MDKMNIRELSFFIIVFISFLWTIGVLLYKMDFQKLRKAISQNSSNNGNITEVDILAPREFVLNLLIKEQEEFDYKILADLAIHWEDIKDGTYKLPQVYNNAIAETHHISQPKDVSHQKMEHNEQINEDESTNNKDFMKFLNPITNVKQ